MSTYYYLVCDDCKEITAAASRTAGGHCPFGDSLETLVPFVIIHSGHNVRIIDEHEEENGRKPEDSYRDYTHWAVDNRKELYDKERDK